jgi:hypothetical protein
METAEAEFNRVNEYLKSINVPKAVTFEAPFIAGLRESDLRCFIMNRDREVFPVGHDAFYADIVGIISKRWKRQKPNLTESMNT